MCGRSPFPTGNSGRGGTWLNYCWVSAAGLSEPLPHYSLFCGNATLSSGTSPLASYKEVPTPPGEFLHKSDRDAFPLAYEWKLQFLVASSILSGQKANIQSTSIRPPFYNGQFLAESPYIDSYLNLSTTATFFCGQGVPLTYLPR